MMGKLTGQDLYAKYVPEKLWQFLLNVKNFPIYFVSGMPQKLLCGSSKGSIPVKDN